MHQSLTRLCDSISILQEMNFKVVKSWEEREWRDAAERMKNIETDR